MTQGYIRVAHIATLVAYKIYRPHYCFMTRGHILVAVKATLMLP